MFLGKKLNNSNAQIKENDTSSKYILKIPYIGKASTLFKHRMMAIVKQTYDVDLYVVFNSFKVKDYFPLNLKCPLT